MALNQTERIILREYLSLQDRIREEKDKRSRLWDQARVATEVIDSLEQRLEQIDTEWQSFSGSTIEERRLQSILTPVIEDKDRLEKEMGETVKERLSLMRRYEDLFGERMSSVLREYGKQEKPGFTHDQIVERIKQQLALHLGDAPYGCLDCYHGKPCIDKLILQLALDRVNRDQEE